MVRLKGNMNQKAIWAFVIAFVLIGILHALSFRYRVTELHDPKVRSLAYVIDNWTGRMWLCQAYPTLDSCQPVETWPGS
jgi:hypothetical protein